MSDCPDPRVTRTARALEQAIVEIASQRPVSQITVAELAHRAGVTRATVYNRYGSPLNLLIQVLDTDLQRGHRQEEQRRVSGGYTATENLRFAIGEVADHITQYMAIYQHALHDPADNGVYEALIRLSWLPRWRRRWPERGRGAIINVTTMVAQFGLAGMALYGSSKAALELLTKSWAAEYGPLESGRRLQFSLSLGHTSLGSPSMS